MQGAKKNIPRIAITVGDPNGIGPEIILKALSKGLFREVEFLILGPKQLFLESVKSLGPVLQVTLELDNEQLSDYNFDDGNIVFVKLPGFREEAVTIGKVTEYGGLIAAESLHLGIALGRKNQIDAIVTAPLSKQALHQAGYSYPGHTEFLAHGFGVDDVVMLMISGDFRVGLVTTHCALSHVPRLISVEAILKKIRIIDDDLRRRFNIVSPKIAVSALNPHAGEAGLFGNEEIESITPAINQAQSEGINAVGPFPADTLFVKAEKKPFDAYLAMYHDQGLIPVKQKYFGKVVNYTAGLPLIRTSPDHGTAFDIAGKGSASPSSIIEAIHLAVEIVSKN